MREYGTIVADPPWQQTMSGKRIRPKGGNRENLPYPTMSTEEIKALSVGKLAADGCHLWLWTTNSFIRSGFEVMESWGFKYLAPVHWLKPSGFGNYVVHRSQTVLLGYKSRCRFDGLRYFPNVFHANPGKHSQKPGAFYDLVEQVSVGPRLELFAREKRLGWHSWGNEVESDIKMETA